MDYEKKIELLTYLVKVRCFEKAVSLKKESNSILGPVHTTIGQEATDVGVCRALRVSDYIIGTHRSHGYMLAKGACENKLMAEIYGKATGFNGGKGGSMHASDKSISSLGASGIVGSGIPLACGAGYASKIKNDGRITCVMFGDGAANEGTFHESLNLASLWKLPVIFVVKNNGLSITATLDSTSSISDFYKRASNYNMKGLQVDGQHVEDVYDGVVSAIDWIKNGNGPVLIESKTIRFQEHQEGLGYKKIAEVNYRDNERLALEIETNCPVNNYINKLINENLITQENVTNIYKEQNEIVEKAIKFAECSPEPEIKTSFTNVFSEV